MALAVISSLYWDTMSLNFLSAYLQALKKLAFSAHIDPPLYVSGSTVLGEIELGANRLREDNIECTYAELVPGTILT